MIVWRNHSYVIGLARTVRVPYYVSSVWSTEIPLSNIPTGLSSPSLMCTSNLLSFHGPKLGNPRPFYFSIIARLDGFWMQGRSPTLVQEVVAWLSAMGKASCTTLILSRALQFWVWHTCVEFNPETKFPSFRWYEEIEFENNHRCSCHVLMSSWYSGLARCSSFWAQSFT